MCIRLPSTSPKGERRDAVIVLSVCFSHFVFLLCSPFGSPLSSERGKGVRLLNS